MFTFPRATYYALVILELFESYHAQVEYPLIHLIHLLFRSSTQGLVSRTYTLIVHSRRVYFLAHNSNHAFSEQLFISSIFSKSLRSQLA